MLILVIDRNDAVAAAMGDFLEHAGDLVDFAADGTTALRLAQTHPYDAIVVDAAESALDGLRVTRRLRAQGAADTPILVLTARNSLQSKLDGFAAGGDDCLAKPFDSLELRARLQALVRRAIGGCQVLRVADLVLDIASADVRRGEVRIKLTPIGLRMLELLMRRAPDVVSRQEIERVVWGDQPPDSAAALRVQVHGLRLAVDRPFARAQLQTVAGRGYRLANDA